MANQAQQSMVPYAAGYPPPTSPNQLATIPESLLHDNALVPASLYHRSPEKKKEKRSYNRADMEYNSDDDDEEDDNDASPMEAMELFTDDDAAQEAANFPSTSDQPVQTSTLSTSSTHGTTQTPSPPDGQYATQSVPAGQETT